MKASKVTYVFDAAESDASWIVEFVRCGPDVGGKATFSATLCRHGRGADVEVIDDWPATRYLRPTQSCASLLLVKGREASGHTTGGIVR